MTKLYPEKLKQAEQLMYNAKYTDALTLIEDFEKRDILTEDDYLSGLILKGNILNRMLSTKKAITVGDQAYQLSIKLENKGAIFESLIIKSHILFLGKIDESYELIIQAEKILEELKVESQEELIQEEKLNYVKSWNYDLNGDYEKAIKKAKQGLGLVKKLGRKLDIARNHILLGTSYGGAGDSVLALENLNAAIAIFEEFQDNINIAWCLYHLGNTYFLIRGELDMALDYYNKGINIDECPLGTRFHMILSIGSIFLLKGELDKAQEYFEKY